MGCVQGVLRLPFLPQALPHCGVAAISSQHGTAQWEEVESGMLLFILKVKYVSQNMLMDSSEDGTTGFGAAS